MHQRVSKNPTSGLRRAKHWTQERRRRARNTRRRKRSLQRPPPQSQSPSRRARRRRNPRRMRRKLARKTRSRRRTRRGMEKRRIGVNGARRTGTTGRMLMATMQVGNRAHGKEANSMGRIGQARRDRTGRSKHTAPNMVQSMLRMALLMELATRTTTVPTTLKLQGNGDRRRKTMLSRPMLRLRDLDNRMPVLGPTGLTAATELKTALKHKRGCLRWAAYPSSLVSQPSLVWIHLRSP
mmetsp:Transcript_37707/g.87071  ORF Transcript_37707/g.87071 Transcript_37707/m.87071 type:complete len:238 (+) Transcript_37707:576-1289(+)